MLNESIGNAINCHRMSGLGHTTVNFLFIDHVIADTNALDDFAVQARRCGEHSRVGRAHFCMAGHQARTGTIFNRAINRITGEKCFNIAIVVGDQLRLDGVVQLCVQLCLARKHRPLLRPHFIRAALETGFGKLMPAADDKGHDRIRIRIGIKRGVQRTAAGREPRALAQ
jgi:hypothetical protein